MPRGTQRRWAWTRIRNQGDPNRRMRVLLGTLICSLFFMDVVSMRSPAGEIISRIHCSWGLWNISKELRSLLYMVHRFSAIEPLKNCGAKLLCTNSCSAVIKNSFGCWGLAKLLVHLRSDGTGSRDLADKGRHSSVSNIWFGASLVQSTLVLTCFIFLPNPEPHPQIWKIPSSSSLLPPDPCWFAWNSMYSPV